MYFFYFSSLQYSSYRENFQGFSTGLLCSSAELRGGPGEAFSAALGRLQEGYSDRSTRSQQVRVQVSRHADLTSVAELNIPQAAQRACK